MNVINILNQSFEKANKRAKSNLQEFKKLIWFNLIVGVVILLGFFHFIFIAIGGIALIASVITFYQIDSKIKADLKVMDNILEILDKIRKSAP